MTSHINQLCETHKLDKLYVSTDEAAGIWIDERMLWIPKIEGPVSYYIGLHEIGHYVTDSLSNKTLEREALAWDWALTIGRINATKPVYQKIKNCLNRYLKLHENLDVPDNFKDLFGLVQNKVKVKRVNADN